MFKAMIWFLNTIDKYYLQILGICCIAIVVAMLLGGCGLQFTKPDKIDLSKDEKITIEKLAKDLAKLHKEIEKSIVIGPGRDLKAIMKDLTDKYGDPAYKQFDAFVTDQGVISIERWFYIDNAESVYYVVNIISGELKSIETIRIK